MMHPLRLCPNLQYRHVFSILILGPPIWQEDVTFLPSHVVTFAFRFFVTQFILVIVAQIWFKNKCLENKHKQSRYNSCHSWVWNITLKSNLKRVLI